MKTSELIREAKRYLWDGTRSSGLYYKSRYICFAIADVPLAAVSQCNKAQFLISKRLGRFETLEDWLKYNGVRSREMTTKRVQAHRLAWMELLAQEFEAKGD